MGSAFYCMCAAEYNLFESCSSQNSRPFKMCLHLSMDWHAFSVLGSWTCFDQDLSFHFWLSISLLGSIWKDDTFQCSQIVPTFHLSCQTFLAFQNSSDLLLLYGIFSLHYNYKMSTWNNQNVYVVYRERVCRGNGEVGNRVDEGLHQSCYFA